MEEAMTWWGWLVVGVLGLLVIRLYWRALSDCLVNTFLTVIACRSHSVCHDML
jgi:hypothetical protein